MKFAHIADCHIGGWKEPKMKELNYLSFSKAIEEILKEKVDFLIVAGDLFNTSFPPIDALKLVISKFKLLKENNIPIYYIAGSHDFSPSGKTMLDIIEEAGLAKDVMRGTVEDEKLKLKFTIDEKTKTKITGIIGKRGMLDKKYYEILERENLENEEGFKIFLFHTTINELKPKHLEKMEGSPVSFLPKNFNYYAGGHVHIVNSVNLEGYENIVYPGPTFPNNFSEIEELSNGTYTLYDNGKIEIKKIKIKEHVSIKIDCKGKTISEINNLLEEQLKNPEDKLFTIKLYGKLDNGKISEIKFKEIFEEAYKNGAYFIMRNTNAIKLDEMNEIKINVNSVNNIEEEVIKENLNSNFPKEKEIALNLLNILDTEKDEGEKVNDFEERIINEMDKVF
jgi:DNA repair protein SbcD/Mre11